MQYWVAVEWKVQKIIAMIRTDQFYWHDVLGNIYLVVNGFNAKKFSFRKSATTYDIAMENTGNNYTTCIESTVYLNIMCSIKV